MGPRARYAAVVVVIALCLSTIAVLTFGSDTKGQGALSAVTLAKIDRNSTPSPWRVSFHDGADLTALAAQFDVWSANHIQKTAILALTGTEAENLRRTGRVVTLDLALAARMNPPLQAATIQGSAGFSCYRTLSETQISMRQLALDYPGLVRTVDYGDSWDKVTPGGPGGHDLEALVISNRQRKGPKFRVFLIGAIHARELATAESALRFAEGLVQSYGTDPDATWLLDYGELHVAPVANPDGREFADQGLLWRKNTNSSRQCGWYNDYGVDLNRNAPFQWNVCTYDSCSSSDPCSQTYRGASPGSEPETQALMTYASSLFRSRRQQTLYIPTISSAFVSSSSFRSYREAQSPFASPTATSGLFISLHSYGRLVLYPWSHTSTPPPDASALDILGRRFGYYTGYVACQLGGNGCLYQADGTLDDWIYGELGIAAYTFEMGDWFFEDCSAYETSIAPSVQNALLYGFKAARRPYQTPRGPEVTAVTVTPRIVEAGASFVLSATIDPTRIAPPFQASAADSAFAARYSVDAPSWLTTTVQFTGSAASLLGEPNATTLVTSISTAGWTPGRHLIFSEGSDRPGRWGVPTGVFIDVVCAPEGCRVYFPILRVNS